MVTTRVLQPPAPADAAVAQRIEAAAVAHDGHESLSSYIERDLQHPSPESIGVLATDGEVPVGYGHLAPSDTTADPHLVAAIVVDPAHRGTGTVARTLLDALVAAGRDRRAERIVLWMNGVDDGTDAIVRAAGFELAGEQFQMRVGLPLGEVPQWPPGITVRSFVPGRDDESWVRVNNRAFLGHPDQGDWSETTLQRRIVEPWFDPAGFLLAVSPDGLAGFCWTKVHEDPRDGRLGEIYVIGVDPDHQGTGLGRALTVGGLDHLHRDRECPTGMLYVDAANPPALGLYRALGFTVHRTDRSYAWSAGA
jgi:mycothiol synthase